MSGTHKGGLRCAETNKKTYGQDYYVTVGRMGGQAPTKKPKGFAAMTPEKRAAAGRKGGKISRRTKVYKQTVKQTWWQKWLQT